MILDSIKQFFTKDNYSMKKAQVYEFLDLTINTITDDIIPSLNNIKETKNLKRIKDNKYFTFIYKECGIKATDNYKAIDKLLEFFTEIQKSNTDLSKIVDNYFQDIVTNKSMSIRSAAIMRILTDIATISAYTSDLLIYLITDEKDTNLPKINFKRVTENAGSYISVMKNYYANYDKILKDIKNIPDDNISIPTDDTNGSNTSMISTFLNKFSIPLPGSNGFIHNPIYHFRMWLVDLDTRKYENLKEKKKYIELKVQELKLREQNENSPELRKQIEYYEDKIAQMEYKMARLKD